MEKRFIYLMNSIIFMENRACTYLRVVLFSIFCYVLFVLSCQLWASLDSCHYLTNVYVFCVFSARFMWHGSFCL